MRASTLFNFVIFQLVCVSQREFTAAQPDMTVNCGICNNTHGNYTSSGTYSRNLKSLLSEVSSISPLASGYYNFSVGQDPDRVYGIAICRADSSPSSCRSCVDDLTHALVDLCPVQKEAAGYYIETCMLRYSDTDIPRVGENRPNCSRTQSPFPIHYPQLTNFKQSLAILIQRLERSTSVGNSSYKFSSGVQHVTQDLTVYGVAQCNPDLSTVECSNCLQQAATSLQQCCINATGAVRFGPFCLLKYGNYPILITVNGNTSMQPSLPTSATHSGTGLQKSGKRNAAYKIWIIVVVVMGLMVFAIAMLGLLSRKRRKQGNDHFKLMESLELDFNTIQFATDNFSDEKRLAGSSVTPMYKGVLPDGQEITVKKLNVRGKECKKEFDNEVLLSANFQHRNLVKFLGSCVQKDVRFLVFEYLPNGTLHDFLSDPIKRVRLDWPTRHHIVRGIARGLLYLHEDSQVRVIHRDIKPSNILLDVQMDPKISNFRTASLVRSNQSKVDAAVLGTYGYMPVEYVQHGHFSIKSDIFSFGIVLLEIISGYIIGEFSHGEKQENLLTYAWMKWCDDTVLDVVDQTLSNIDRHANQIKRCIKIGLLCVEEDPRHRPSMSSVIFMLNSDTLDISEPIRPAPPILNDTGLHSDSHTTETHDSHQTSLNDASISTLDPR